MGRKSRAKKERRELQSKPIFHMAVGASPIISPARSGNVLGGISLGNEIRLVKTALLYSDKVTLYSMATSMLAFVLALNHLNISQKMDFIVQIAPVIMKGEQKEVLVKNMPALRIMMANRGSLSPDQLLQLLNFESQIETLWEPMRAQIEQMAVQAGVPELDKAINTGLVTVELFGAGQGQKSNYVRLDDIVANQKSADSNKMIAEYLNSIARVLIEGDTYPLFDNMTGDIIRHMVQEDRIQVSEARAARGKHTLLARNLLEKLPLFEEATVDEVIDIRKELDRSLVNFRKAVIDFSNDVKTAAWDKEFPFEADNIFHKEVAPAILEIEEQVKQSRSLVNLVARLTTKPIVTGGALSVLLSPLQAIPELAGIGGFVAAGTTVALEYRELLKERKAVENNQLYFYYKVGKLFSE